MRSPSASTTRRCGSGSGTTPPTKSWSDEHGSWEGIVLANSSNPEHTRYENMTVAEIARERGDADPGTTCIELMAEAGGSIGGIFFAMSEEDVREVMQVPWVRSGHRRLGDQPRRTWRAPP